MGRITNDAIATAAALVFAIGFGVIAVSRVRRSNDWSKRDNDKKGSNLSS